MVSIAVAAILLQAPIQEPTIKFSGRTWHVRGVGRGGPGPNEWDPKQVWLDKSGYLHLRVSQIDGKWRCAELGTTERLGFGTYRFEIEGRVDQLDKNVVLGLFHYPTPDVGPDATNEIDIEFARWGDATAPIGNYTVWPLSADTKRYTHSFEPKLKGTRSVHSYTWTKNSIRFESPNTGVVEYKPANPEQVIAQKPMPLNLNLWLFEGNAPSDGKPIEIIIRSVRYTPAPTTD